MRAHLPTPTERESQLRRQHRERQAHELIEALATLRSTWAREQCTQAAFEQLAEQWQETTVTEADVEVLRGFERLPASLTHLIYNLSANVASAWSSVL